MTCALQNLFAYSLEISLHMQLFMAGFVCDVLIFSTRLETSKTNALKMQPEDCYNMDEKGLLIGRTHKAD
jgi:hypothetical protein